MLHVSQIALIAGMQAYGIDFAALFDGSTGYLSRTPSVAGDRKTWTWSGWVSRTSPGAYENIFGAMSGSNTDTLRFDPADKLEFIWNDVVDGHLLTTQAFKDTTGFPIHIVVQMDTTQVTASDRYKLWVNGVQITSFATATYPAQNRDGGVNNTVAHTIGRYTASAIRFNRGYMALPILIDGQALDASSFGTFDSATGLWKPKAYAGTYGTCGYNLDFHQDNGGTPSLGNDLGTDVSGNGNHWTVSATGVMQVTSTPTNVYAALDPNDKGSSLTLSNGNRTVVGGAAHNTTMGTFVLPDNGKYYWEYIVDVAPSASVADAVGVAKTGTPANRTVTSNSLNPGLVLYNFNGGIQCNENTVAVFSVSAAWPIGTRLQCAVDLDNNKFWFGVNNSWYDSAGGATGNPTTGVNPVSITNFTGGYTPTAGGYNTGLTTAFEETDWTYAAPTGFKSLCTSNMPARSPKVPSTPQTGNVVCNGTTDNAMITLNMVPDKAGTSTVNAVTLVPGTNCIYTATGVKLIDAAFTGTLTYSIAVKAHTGGSNVPPANAQVNP